MPTQTIKSTATYPWFYKDRYSSSGLNVAYEAFRRERVWSTTPSYRTIKRSVLGTLGYTDVSYTQRFGVSKVGFAVANGGCTVDCALTPGLQAISVNDATLTDLYNKCVSSAADKVGDYTIDLGVTAVEAKKTGEMLFKAASTLVSAARNVRKSNFAKAASELGIPVPKKCRSTRSFESNWLEYRYGWRTLMMDCDGAVRALAESMVSKPPILVVKTRQVADSTTTVGPTRSGINGALGYEDAMVTRMYSYHREASLMYKFSVSNSLLSGANSLGLVNPLTLAWELIPMSFVADWFVNIGDVLRHLTTFEGKTFIDGSKCLVNQVEVWSSCDNFRTKMSNYPLRYDTGAGPTAYSYSKSRAFSRFRVGSFQSVVPRLNISLNIGRAADAGALLRQFFRR